MTSCVRELRVTYTPRTARPLPLVGGPADAAATVRERLEWEAVEVALVLLVNTKRRLIAVHELGRGTLDSCIVHPRDVFKVALLANASGVIVTHNHPSGDPSPSPDDLALYTRLRQAAEVVGIELLDFVIVAGASYFSFRQMGK